MIDFLSTILTIISALAFVGTAMLPASVNVPRKRRHQQYLMPLVALIYAIVALLVLYKFNDFLDRLITLLFNFLPFLQGFLSTNMLFYFENLLVVVVFLIIKGTYRGIAKRTFTGNEFFGSKFVSDFYEYDGISNRWYVLGKLGHGRALFLALYIASLVCVFGIIFAMQRASGWPGFAAVSFPVLGALLVGEVYFALHGFTLAEVKQNLYGEDDDAYRIANYSALRKVYRKLFPERISHEGVDLSGPINMQSFAAIHKLKNSSDEMDRVCGEYFEQLKRSGKDIDENLMNASIGMLAGKSIVVATPFYHDLTPYLAFSVYVKLLQGGKCLLVVGRDSEADSAKKWIEAGLQDISGIADLWRVDQLSKLMIPDIDVGILRAADLHNVEIFRANDAFLRSVEIVLIAEPSLIIATGQLGLGVIAEQVSRKGQPVYAAFDRNADGLVDALSHVLKTNVTSVVATQPNRGSSSDIVWRAEGEHLAPNIFRGVARDLGIGTELAAVAMKYSVENIQWLGGDSYPVLDMAWIAGQYFEPITSFAELPNSQSALSDALTPYASVLSVPQSKRSFIVADDSFTNVYESLRMYGSRSIENGFVHLISEEYLLRDYMVDNRHVFESDRKAIPTIVADYARSPRNTVMRLLLEMVTYSVPLSSIHKDLELAGCIHVAEEYVVTDDDILKIEEPEAINVLRRLLVKFFGISEDVSFVMHRIPTDQPGIYNLSFAIRDTAPFKDVLRALRTSYFLVEDENEEENYISGCLCGHVHQTVLPGQFLTYGGKYYQVEAINAGEKNEVLLKRAADHIEGRPHYRSLVSLTLNDMRPVGRIISQRGSEAVVIQRFTADVQTVTTGYLDLPNRSDLANARKVDIPGLEPRVYQDKDILRIRLAGASEQIRVTVATMLNELFVTTFGSGNFVYATTVHPKGTAEGLLPDLTLEFSYSDIFVGDGDTLSDAGDGEAENYDNYGDTGAGLFTSQLANMMDQDNENSIYIVEDSDVDLGYINAVERNWERFLEIIADYLAWNATPYPEPESIHAVASVFPGENETDVAARDERKQAEEDGTADKNSGQLSLWQRIKRWFKKHFGRAGKEKTDTDTEENTESDTEEQGEQQPEQEIVSETEVVVGSDTDSESEIEVTSEVDTQGADDSPNVADVDDTDMGMDSEVDAAEPEEVDMENEGTAEDSEEIYISEISEEVDKDEK